MLLNDPPYLSLCNLITLPLSHHLVGYPLYFNLSNSQTLYKIPILFINDFIFFPLLEIELANPSQLYLSLSKLLRATSSYLNPIILASERKNCIDEGKLDAGGNRALLSLTASSTKASHLRATSSGL